MKGDRLPAGLANPNSRAGLDESRRFRRARRMSYRIILLVVLACAGQPVQAAMNARLRVAVESPAPTASVSFVVGGPGPSNSTITGMLVRGSVPGLGHVP